MLDRRSFLSAAGAGFVSNLFPRAAEALDRAEHVFAAACRKPDGGYAVAVTGSDGRILHLSDGRIDGGQG